MKQHQLLLLLASLSTIQTMASSLIINGGFEQPAATVNQGALTSLPGWTLSDNVDIYYTDTYPAAEGYQCLDLSGLTQAGSYIAQYFATVPGQQYHLSFIYANNCAVAESSGTVRIRGNATLLETTVSHSGSTPSAMNYSPFHANFTADSSLTELRFTHLTTPTAGLILDAVRVAVLMPPSSIIIGGFEQTRDSPVGTWEVTIGGGNRGIAFLTFNDDFSISGYGMTRESWGPFTVQGNWTLDARGNLLGTYTENLYGKLMNGSFIGKARTGRSMRVKVVATNGRFTLSGVPVRMTPDISGNWTAYVTQRKITVPEFITLTSSSGFPGMFDVLGTGSGPSGSFAVSGNAIVTSKRKAVVFSVSDFTNGGIGLGSLTGGFSVSGQTGSLIGETDSGERLRARTTR